MNDLASLRDVPKNMRLTGMLLFRSAFMEALDNMTPMCVVHAAHAAEILLKARIAQEHPLLIFSKLPKPNVNKDNLTLIDLLENGRTFSYADLPNQLWATTGIKIDKLDQYIEFGKLRNQVIHFSRTTKNELDILTLKYSLELLDPLVENFWGKSVIDFVKNDPYSGSSDIFQSGELEESIISKGFVIDQRLRCILGEKSKQAWTNRQEHYKYMDEQHKAKTDEDWKAEYDAYMESHDDSYENDNYKEIEEDFASWKTFQDSF